MHKRISVCSHDANPAVDRPSFHIRAYRLTSASTRVMRYGFRRRASRRGLRGGRRTRSGWLGREYSARRGSRGGALIIRCPLNLSITAPSGAAAIRGKSNSPQRKSAAAFTREKWRHQSCQGCQWCGTVSPKDRTRRDRVDRATFGGHHSASGSLRLFEVQPPLAAGGRALGVTALPEVQGQAMERYGARVPPTGGCPTRNSDL